MAAPYDVYLVRNLQQILVRSERNSELMRVRKLEVDRSLMIYLEQAVNCKDQCSLDRDSLRSCYCE